MENRREKEVSGSTVRLDIEVKALGDGFTWDTNNPEQDRQTASKAMGNCRTERY